MVRRSKPAKRTRKKRDKGQGVNPPSRSRGDQEVHRWTEECIQQLKEIHAARTPQEKVTDEALLAELAPTPSHWIREPEKYDVHGIDYPEARTPKEKQDLPYHKRQEKGLTKRQEAELKEQYAKVLSKVIPQASQEELERLAEMAYKEEWIKPDDDPGKALQRVAPKAQAELAKIRAPKIKPKPESSSVVEEVDLPPRGTGLETGQADQRRKGEPRTEEERRERHREKAQDAYSQLIEESDLVQTVNVDEKKIQVWVTPIGAATKEMVPLVTIVEVEQGKEPVFNTRKNLPKDDLSSLLGDLRELEKKPEPKPEKKAREETYMYYADPGHGWLRVPVKKLEELGIADDISPYSYRKGRYAYLEEDRDATLFIHEMESRGVEVKFKEKLNESESNIRGYDPYYGPRFHEHRMIIADAKTVKELEEIKKDLPKAAGLTEHEVKTLQRYADLYIDRLQGKPVEHETIRRAKKTPEQYAEEYARRYREQLGPAVEQVTASKRLQVMEKLVAEGHPRDQAARISAMLTEKYVFSNLEDLVDKYESHHLELAEKEFSGNLEEWEKILADGMPEENARRAAELIVEQAEKQLIKEAEKAKPSPPPEPRRYDPETEKIIEKILDARKDLTREQVKNQIRVEKEKSQGLLTDEAAATLAAHGYGLTRENLKTEPKIYDEDVKRDIKWVLDARKDITRADVEKMIEEKMSELGYMASPKMAVTSVAHDLGVGVSFYEELEKRKFWAYSGADGDLYRKHGLGGWRVQVYWGTDLAIQKKHTDELGTRWITVADFDTENMEDRKLVLDFIDKWLKNPKILDPYTPLGVNALTLYELHTGDIKTKEPKKPKTEPVEKHVVHSRTLRREKGEKRAPFDRKALPVTAAVLHPKQAVIESQGDTMTFEGMDPGHVSLLKITLPNVLEIPEGRYEAVEGGYVFDERVTHQRYPQEVAWDDMTLSVRARNQESRVKYERVPEFRSRFPEPRVFYKVKAELDLETLRDAARELERGGSESIALKAKRSMEAYGDTFIYTGEKEEQRTVTEVDDGGEEWEYEETVKVPVTRSLGSLMTIDEDEVTASYSTEKLSENLDRLTRAGFKGATLEFRTDMPLKIVAKREDGAEARFWLAPMIGV
jgi:hypothetical protein